MAAASPVRRGYVLLQAAVAEAALSEVELAYGRIGELTAGGDDTVLPLVRVCVDYVSRIAYGSGDAWTRHTDEAGNMVNIEERSPARRVFSFRLLAAWSAQDTGMFDALLQAACADPDRRRAFLRDVFELTLDLSQTRGEQVGNPHTLVYQLTESIRRLAEQDRAP